MAVSLENVMDMLTSLSKVVIPLAEDLPKIRAQQKTNGACIAVISETLADMAGTLRQILAGMGQDDDDKGRDKLTETLEKLVKAVESLHDELPRAVVDEIAERQSEDEEA